MGGGALSFDFSFQERTILATFICRRDFQANPAQALDDVPTARRVLIVLAGTLVLFFFQNSLHVSSTFIALCGAAVALVWIRPAINELLKKIEWSVLIFFAGLFVMVGGVEASGALKLLSGLLAQLNTLPPLVLGVTLIWVIACLSAVVDNVPITIAMILVIEGMGALLG